MTTWGLAATILAPAPEILAFAAYHLEAGAHRLYLYLDVDTPDAYAPLKAHPKVRVQTCDEVWWQKRLGRRPDQHQIRQAQNATHAYNRRAEVDWLIHMDVDEFLVSDQPIADTLAALPDDVEVARARPMELLADGDGTAYKAFLPPGPAREGTIARLYPTFGHYLRAGFLSHTGGKVFVRTGMTDVKLRIHNAFRNDSMLAATELAQIDLAHKHAKDWTTWRRAFDYRLRQGSYRADLDKTRSPDKGLLSLHDLFTFLLAEEGEDGLRAFHAEVAADSPEMRARLDDAGLLRLVDLDLDALLRKHFPSSV